MSGEGTEMPPQDRETHFGIVEIISHVEQHLHDLHGHCEQRGLAPVIEEALRANLQQEIHALRLMSAELEPTAGELNDSHTSYYFQREEIVYGPRPDTNLQ